MRAETYGDQTSLTIDVTEREDTGNYKIVLQNEAGEATAAVKVKVVGETIEVLYNRERTLRSRLFISMQVARWRFKHPEEAESRCIVGFGKLK